MKQDQRKSHKTDSGLWVIFKVCLITVCLALSVDAPVNADLSAVMMGETGESKQDAVIVNGEQTTEKQTPDSGIKTQALETSRQPSLKDDPCLPPLYSDWGEFSVDHNDYRRSRGIVGARIVIDIDRFTMTLEAVYRNGETGHVLSQDVAVGDEKSPTPEGSFLVNHVYCYPDVLFFGDHSSPVQGLYNGFFAPLLICDDQQRCKRFKELGLHGFQGKFHPNLTSVNQETFGAVSGGCIRISDPCSFKRELLKLVGTGPLRKNDRGSYHWLNKTVMVTIKGAKYDEQEKTLASMIEESIFSIGSEISSLVWSIYK